MAILIYHRVSPQEDNWSFEPLSPPSFERQIEYLCRNSELLALDKLVQYLQEEKPLPEKAAVITFDDGYKDNYLYAYPTLKKYHVPATVFLATGHIGTGKLFWWDKVSYVMQNTPMETLDLNKLGIYSLRSKVGRSRAAFMICEKLTKLSEEEKNLLIEKLLSISGTDIHTDLGKELILSWDEVKEMSNDGIAFGAHSVNHPVLTNLPLAQANWEVLQSKKDIEGKLSRVVTAFSYPNGNFSPELVKTVKENGFTCAVSVSPSKLITSKDSPYELSRIGAVEDLNKFKAKLCGLSGDLQGILSGGKR